MTTRFIAPNTARTELAPISAFLGSHTDYSQPTHGPCQRKHTQESSSSCKSQNDSQEGRPCGSTRPCPQRPAASGPEMCAQAYVLCLVTKSKGFYYSCHCFISCPALLCAASQILRVSNKHVSSIKRF